MIYLILPAYNEEKNLLKIFKKLNNLTIAKKFIVILVDDCSNDKTFLIAKNKNKFKLIYKKHKQNKGLSIALETGFNVLRKRLKKEDLVVTMDSDNTHPISIIPNMLRQIKKNKADIIIASRFLSMSRVNGLSVFRKYLRILAKCIFSFFFPYENLREYTCNFRIYRAFLIKDLIKNKNFFKNEDFNIAVKIILNLIKRFKNLKISEYPLVLNYHYKIGASKMKVFKNIFLTLNLILFKKF